MYSITLVSFLILIVYSGASPTNKHYLENQSLRIVGGQNATRGEFPYQISFQQLINSEWEHLCGGSIISDTWVLFAAHCITRGTNISNYRVVAGILNLNETELNTTQIVPIANYVIHENYPMFPWQPEAYDIALLQLETPLNFTDDVQPISLPPALYESDGNATVTGWGMSQPPNETLPNTLQKAVVPFLNNTLCYDVFDEMLQNSSMSHNPFDIESDVCTGPVHGDVTPCFGDSGGPLAQNKTLIGIVSWGNMQCGVDGGPTPAAYTRVSYYIEWIRVHTNGTVGFEYSNSVV